MVFELANGKCPVLVGNGKMWENDAGMPVQSPLLPGFQTDLLMWDAYFFARAPGVG